MAYQAVILAAGRGSRLSSETKLVPKALLPIGPRTPRDETETTFLRRQIELLGELGVQQVVTVVGVLREQIIAALARWAPHVQIVVNPTVDESPSGSLHSFQFAANAELKILDGNSDTLLMDADIVYHRDVLERILETSAESCLLVCKRIADNDEEVLVYGTAEAPRLLGKGLTARVVGEAPCLGEAVGIVKFAAADHALARASMNWMLGDPAAPKGSARRAGFGPARSATEHEQLTQHLMHLGRMKASVFSGLPFMEVDTADEYRELRETFYPKLLDLESSTRADDG